MEAISKQLEGALATARALGFLGPGPIAQHLVSARRFADAFRAHRVVGATLDLGSGGGVPGLILAEWLPETRWVLLDANRRRTSFLADAVATCGLATRVAVVRGRAEEVAHLTSHREVYAAVTARGFGSPAATAEIAAGFVAEGGVALISDTFAERPWPAARLALLAFRPTESTPGLRVLRKTGPVPADFPRTAVRQRRDPLF
ncbi:MAG TPA: RsmG family class I SAM-dependent methyltransferase [Acidimicrobiales bacterium]|nr:RsmG family class I SAM-dependent methyltransferase [Acidimicrobiales bacterium]